MDTAVRKATRLDYQPPKVKHLTSKQPFTLTTPPIALITDIVFIQLSMRGHISIQLRWEILWTCSKSVYGKTLGLYVSFIHLVLSLAVLGYLFYIR